MELPNLQVVNLPIDQLIPYANNARTHSTEQIAQIAASIKEFGFCDPIALDAANGIIAGHGRLQAARLLGLTHVPTIQLGHLTKERQKAYILAHNRIAISAGWDSELLAIELRELEDEGFDLSITGFTEEEISAYTNPEILMAGLGDEEAVPELKEQPVTVTGDTWLLGVNRLRCGDTTNIEAVEALMNGSKADLVFTDPPYNVDYEGYTEEKLKIEKDSMSDDQFKQFLADVFASYAVIVKDTASMYVCHGSVYQREFQNALEANEFEVRCQIIWAKSNFGWGFGRYKFKHEPIFYCHRKGQSDSWYGDKTQSTLWEVDKPSANKIHPTMKPIELIEMALKNSSRPNDLVVDLFGGSGSTLIACEKTGRKCYTMELSPHYCDVIVKRWQEFTGKKATLETNGLSFEDVANGRLPEGAAA